MRPAGAGFGAGIDTGRAAPPVHAPKCWRASAVASSSVIAPTKTSAELPGFQRSLWNSASVLARERLDGPRRSPGPDGRTDDRRRRRGCRARAPRWRRRSSRSAAGASSCRFFSRSTSAAGNVGCCTTSAMMASAGPRLRFSTSKPTDAISRWTLPSSVAPRSPNAFSMSSALRVFVPMSMRPHRHRRGAVLARGIGDGAGARRDGDRHLRQIARSTTKSSSPFSSLAVCTVGATNGRSSPNAGCFERSSVDSAGRPDVSGRKRTSSRFRVFSQRCAAFRTSPTVSAR